MKNWLKKIGNRIHIFFGSITNQVYVASIVISLLLIILSNIRNINTDAKTVLISIGCSGMAAAIMAIFIDMAQKKQEESRNMQLKKYNLSGLYYELKSFFERLIWFDEILSTHEIDNDIEYYLSSDFLTEALSWNVYSQEDYKEICSSIKELIDKYNKDSWKESENITHKKVEKMFYIISNASIKIQEEMTILNKNRNFLVANSIVTIEEINELNVCVGKFIELLGVKGTNYSTSLHFLFSAFDKIKDIGNYDDELYIITWHPKDDIVDLLLEDRKKYGDSNVQITYIK